eukprot:TRINITY_DN3315_c0_g1_i2.p2 TRINITY_DN3315_c0_g1~~TRINITY_DN3315_c0_g1_i2.p2  ORF type:complete len:126 (-),score=31.44 TRINITY_DN3315_c0_g1_i2:258-635(-)
MEKYATVMPSVNQFEYHPYYQQPELVQFCTSRNIQVVAYSSLGQGKLLSDETVIDVATKIQKTPSQVLLRWAVQQSIVVIPKSQNEERIKENSLLFDFELSATEMERLNKLERNQKFCWDANQVV